VIDIRKTLATNIGMVLVAQVAGFAAKWLGWQPVAQHSWLTLCWFPWAFLWASMALAAVMLFIGMLFERGMWKLEAWLEKEAKR
jgi:hypothetical protein